MGLFQCFQKRSKKDKDIGGKQKGRRTPSNSPASSDDGIVETTKRKPMSPKGHTGMLQSPRGHSSMRKSQLGRISEEPTAVRLAPLKARQEVPPPPAREAAFHGPPRFDWIDIETSAATKIQSVYRRNRVMTELDRQGVTTSAIRNQKRRHRAKRGKPTASEDTPSFLSCCAVGLAFGEATEDDDEAYRDYQKRQYEERVKQQQMHEDALRKRYLRSHGAGVGKVVEQIEVVE